MCLSVDYYEDFVFFAVAMGALRAGEACKLLAGLLLTAVFLLHRSALLVGGLRMRAEGAGARCVFCWKE